MATETWLPMIDKRRCTFCGACVTNWPTGALALVGQLAVVTRPDACTYCVRCDELVTNPGVEEQLRAGDVLAVLGNHTELALFTTMAAAGGETATVSAVCSR